VYERSHCNIEHIKFALSRVFSWSLRIFFFL